MKQINKVLTGGGNILPPQTAIDMKSTEIFKKTIQTYLEQQAASDELFA
jgi:hypothetical protein